MQQYFDMVLKNPDFSVLSGLTERVAKSVSLFSDCRLMHYHTDASPTPNRRAGLLLLHFPGLSSSPLQEYDDQGLIDEWEATNPVFDAPLDEKLALFRQTRVFWLDNGLISYYVEAAALSPGLRRLLEDSMDARSFLENCLTPSGYWLRRSLERYADMSRLESFLLRSYVDSLGGDEPITYDTILQSMENDLRYLYANKLPKPDNQSRSLLYSQRLLSGEYADWMLCADDFWRHNLSLPTLNIYDAILGCLSTIYWRECKDISCCQCLPLEDAQILFPLSEREALWNTYYQSLRGTLLFNLQCDDSCTKTPTEKELQEALLRREVEIEQKRASYPPISAELHRRVLTFVEQFYDYFGGRPNVEQTRQRPSRCPFIFPNELNSAEQIDLDLLEASRGTGAGFAKLVSKYVQLGLLRMPSSNVQDFFYKLIVYYPDVKTSAKNFLNNTDTAKMKAAFKKY